MKFHGRLSLVFLITVLFVSCRYNVEKITSFRFNDRLIPIPSEDQLDRDVDIIPDKYNTGIEPGVVLKTLDIGEDETTTVNGVVIMKRKIVSQKTGAISYEYTIGGNKCPNIANEVVIENYDFSDRKFAFINQEKFNSNKTIIFRNCKFKNVQQTGDNIKLYLIFENCTFLGNISETNIMLDKCYIGGFLKDGMNPLKNFIVTNSYIADLVCMALPEGDLHIDGFQMFGREGIVGGNVLINNVRFEIPSIYYSSSKAAVNACVMFQLEFGSIHNCYFMNLICNGGGKHFPLYLKKNPRFPSRNINLVNVDVSNNFGTIFYPTDYHTEANVKNVTHLDKLYVSSVWKDSSNCTHIICTNDTSIDKTLTVKTDKGNFTFEIPHCPSNWALVEGTRDGKVNPNEALTDPSGISYHEYKFADLPFDVDCKITTDVKSVTCYDGDKVIRKVKF